MSIIAEFLECCSLCEQSHSPSHVDTAACTTLDGAGLRGLLWRAGGSFPRQSCEGIAALDRSASISCRHADTPGILCLHRTGRTWLWC